MKKLASPDLIYLTFIILFSVFFIFFGLGVNHLIEFDEGIYALVAKNILKTGDWFTLHWRLSSPWFDKGPFYLWFTAVFIKIFGLTSFSVRLTSALLGVLGIISVYLLGNKLYSRTVGFLSSIILASSVGYLSYARLGMLDVPNAALNSLSLYFLVSALDQPIFWYPAAAVLGLGFLNRQLLAFLGLASFFLFCITKKDRPLINRKKLVGPALVFLVIVLPWHLVESWKFGKDFWEVYFFHQTLSRFSQTIEGKYAPFFWYLTVAKVHLRIWFPVFLLALFYAFYKAFRKEASSRLLLIWVVLTFVAFTLAKSKLIWYIMPLYPPVAIITARFLQATIEKLKFRNFFIGVILLTAVFYNFKNWSKIEPRDFNYDQAKLIEYKNNADPKAPLLAVGYSYSVSQFYSLVEVTPIPKEEMRGFFEALNYKYAIITLGDLNSLPDKGQYRIIYSIGDGALISKINK